MSELEKEARLEFLFNHIGLVLPKNKVEYLQFIKDNDLEYLTIDGGRKEGVFDQLGVRGTWYRLDFKDNPELRKEYEDWKEKNKIDTSIHKMKITALEVKGTGCKTLSDCSTWDLFSVSCMTEDNDLVYARDIGLCVFPLEIPDWDKVCRCVEKQLNAELTNKDALIKAWKHEWKNKS